MGGYKPSSEWVLPHYKNITPPRFRGGVMNCYMRILKISYRNRKTNDYVRQKIEERRKLHWCGHITCHDSLAKIILQGTVEGGRKRGNPKKSWLSNIKA